MGVFCGADWAGVCRLIEYVEGQEDPFLADYKETNPWSTGPGPSAPCCSVM